MIIKSNVGNGRLISVNKLRKDFVVKMQLVFGSSRKYPQSFFRFTTVNDSNTKTVIESFGL